MHVVNAGDGRHAHPTQGLLDMYTIRHFKKDFTNLSVAIVVLCLDHFLRVFSGLGPQVLAPDVHGMPRGLLSFFIGVLVWYGWQAVPGPVPGHRRPNAPALP